MCNSQSIKEYFSQYKAYSAQDVFKFCYQSVFGCEHIVRDLEGCVQWIKDEFAQNNSQRRIENLAGNFARVHLGFLAKGLSPETFGKLLYLSAKREKGSREDLEQMLSLCRKLVQSGEISVALKDFDESLIKWREQGFPAIHHSKDFRQTYAPAYRVIHADFVPFIDFLCNLDLMLKEKSVILAIEGGSASGKSTLAKLLEEIYSCTVFHVDDFFLQPHQRTENRLEEVGGNFDRERFISQVLLPLKAKGEVDYVRFDCSNQTLLPPEKKTKTHLTVIEGAYSMHPELENAYDYSVFLSVSEKTQKARIEKRNTPAFAKRFFNEWIPKEKKYFEEMCVKERCQEIIEIE